MSSVKDHLKQSSNNQTSRQRSDSTHSSYQSSNASSNGLMPKASSNVVTRDSNKSRNKNKKKGAKNGPPEASPNRSSSEAGIGKRGKMINEEKSKKSDKNSQNQILNANYKKGGSASNENERASSSTGQGKGPLKKNRQSNFTKVINQLPEEELKVTVLKNMDNVFQMLADATSTESLRFKYGDDYLLREFQEMDKPMIASVYAEDLYKASSSSCLLEYFGRCSSPKICGCEHGGEWSQINKMRDLILGQHNIGWVCSYCKTFGGSNLDEAVKRVPLYQVGEMRSDAPNEGMMRFFACRFCYEEHKKADYVKLDKVLENALEDKNLRPRMFDIFCDIEQHNSWIKWQQRMFFASLDFSPRRTLDGKGAKPTYGKGSRNENNNRNLNQRDDMVNKRNRNSELESSSSKGSPEKKPKAEAPQLQRPSRSSASSSLLSSSDEVRKSGPAWTLGRRVENNNTTAKADEVMGAANSESEEEDDDRNTDDDSDGAGAEDDEIKTESVATEGTHQTNQNQGSRSSVDENQNVNKNESLNESENRGDDDEDSDDNDACLLPKYEMDMIITPKTKQGELMKEIGPLEDNLTSLNVDKLKPVLKEAYSNFSELTIGAVIGKISNICYHEMSKRSGCLRKPPAGIYGNNNDGKGDVKGKSDFCSYRHTTEIADVIHVLNLKKILGYECAVCHSVGSWSIAECMDRTHLKLFPDPKDNNKMRPVCFSCSPRPGQLKGTDVESRIIKSPIMRDIWRCNASWNYTHRRQDWLCCEDEFKRCLDPMYRVGKGSLNRRGKGGGK